MNGIDIAERAAILEYDCGLPRAEAEAQALREMCEQASDASGILGELVKAERYRLHPDLASVLGDLGLSDVRGPAWGFDHVVPSRKPIVRQITRSPRLPPSSSRPRTMEN